MPEGRRVQRINHPSIEVKVRFGPLVETIELWREDHFEHSTYSPLDGPQTQRWLVLDFGTEERSEAVLEDDPSAGKGAKRPKVDENDEPVIIWQKTGAVVVELQRVSDDGVGMSVPTTKVIMPIDDRPSETRIQTKEIDTGWLGWLHVPDSERRPDGGHQSSTGGDSEADVVGRRAVAEELAAAMIAEFKQADKHVGLSVNYGDRRCYVCEQPWPCTSAVDFDATADVDDSETHSSSAQGLAGG